MNILQTRFPFLVSRIYPSARWNVSTKEKNVYLTFDDGPVPGVTDKVLEILDEYKAKAVFFCLGSRISSNPEMGIEILKRGHLIGNHSWSHADAWKVSMEEFVADVLFSQNTISRLTGKEPVLFRPPYGHLTRRSIHALNPKLQPVMWSLMPGDFDPHLSPEKCLKRAVQGAKSGSIIVFHDSEKAGATLLKILPQFLQTLKAEGFSFPLIP